MYYLHLYIVLNVLTMYCNILFGCHLNFILSYLINYKYMYISVHFHKNLSKVVKILNIHTKVYTYG